MARRKKTSPFEDLIDLVAMLPWWACIALAIVSYLVLSGLAKPVAVTAVQPGDIAHVATQAMWKAFAYAGQFIVPAACVIAAVVSAYRRHERKQLVSNVTVASSSDALGDMTWREFEVLVGEGFRLQGYEVTETGGGGADGGVDLVLRKDREKYLVQCKQWKAFKVGVTVVRELYGVMAAHGAAGGFVVTSGRFTDEAKAFADGRNIRLVDGPKLFGMIKQAKAAGAVSRGPELPSRGPAATPTAAAPATTPPCPVCASAMVLRTAKRGANAGSEFWGCTKYPSCKGTRPTVFRKQS
jgi:restriction system protein